MNESILALLEALAIGGAFILGWSLCERRAFWKMNATYQESLMASEDEKENARRQKILELLEAEDDTKEHSLPPPPPLPQETRRFKWLRHKRT